MNKLQECLQLEKQDRSTRLRKNKRKNQTARAPVAKEEGN